MDIKTTLVTLVRDGFILVFNQDKLDIVRTAEALLAAGISNMEVTCRIKQPLEKLSRLRKELPDFVAGAASLIDWPGMLKVYNAAHADDPLPTLQQVVDAGAAYLVSAVNFSDAGLARFAGKVPMIPGCGTATEIVSQYSKGANLCKVFPAKECGLAFARPSTSHPQDDQPGPHWRNDGVEHLRFHAAGVLVLGGSFSDREGHLARIVDD